MNVAASSPPAQKLLGLEVLRFAAAFAVLVLHYQHFSYVGDMPSGLVRDRLPFAALLWPLYHAGQYGVWVFWCISGFIFTFKYRDQIGDRAISGWRFFVLRFSRLYPLHIVMLVVVAILQPIHFRLQGNWFVYQDNDLVHFLLQLGLATGWGTGQGDSFNGPIWSISAEVLVYAIFFLSLRHVSKSPILNVVAIGICLNLSGQVFSCLAFFYAGGLAAIARRNSESMRMRSALTMLVLAVVAISLFSIWHFRLPVTQIDWLLFLTLTPAIVFVLASDIRLPKPCETVIVTAGNMTYSSYLLHFPFQLLLACGFGLAQRPLPYYDDWFLLTFVGITLLASYATFRYFEMPAQTFLRDRLLPAPPLASRPGYAKLSAT